MIGTNGCRKVLLYVMVGSGPAPALALVIPNWHRGSSRDTPDQTPGPVLEAKGMDSEKQTQGLVLAVGMEDAKGQVGKESQVTHTHRKAKRQSQEGAKAAKI